MFLPGMLEPVLLSYWAIAITASIVGFIGGKVYQNRHQRPHDDCMLNIKDDERRRSFFAFTQLVLDLLPVFLRSNHALARFSHAVNQRCSISSMKAILQAMLAREIQYRVAG